MGIPRSLPADVLALPTLAWIFTASSHLTFWAPVYRNFKTSRRPSHQGIGVET